MNGITILDSTLRDGAQGGDVTFSLEDKLAAVQVLDRLGVAYIEAGNPGSNPKDEEFFRLAANLPLKHARLAAFGSTRRKNLSPEEDENLAALANAGAPCCVIFGKCWKFHVRRVLETAEEENLLMIEESCRFLKEHGREVIFDGEHFFDGWKDNPDYAMASLKAAVRGGADVLCLCDTNGGVFPQEAADITKAVADAFSVPVAVHFHNDCGLAVANSIAAVKAGARQVQGTMLGFGERCGNANLSSVIPDLQIKLGITCVPDECVPLLSHGAGELAAAANLDISASLPYVGRNAFSHKAGMHAAGVLKDPCTFEHIDPALVGNVRRFPASEISGRAVIVEKLRRIFPESDIGVDAVSSVLRRLKELEADGYQFEGADASFELLARKLLRPYLPFFKLLYYHIYTDFGEKRESGASATVKVQVGKEIQLTAAEGNGPVNAMDRALRKALEVFYPVLSHVKLTDYKVRVLDTGSATAARVRVLITSTDGEEAFTTVGVSEDVVAASWRALEDSMEYLLLKAQRLGVKEKQEESELWQ